MPSYAAQVASGRGVFKARLVIEGWPDVFVDDASLEMTQADDRVRLGGLDPYTLRLSATADLVRADLEQSEMTVELVDDHAHLLSASMSTRPTAKTWLVEDLIVGQTTAYVASTAGFASAGYLHCHTECIEYTGTTGGATPSFTGLTRGSWDTVEQAHYTADGADLAFPQITDLPTTTLGRRVSIYLYGRGDDVTGTGTLRWRGVCRSAPEYSEGRWTIAVEPMAWILEQPMGSDTSIPGPPRGIYLPASSPLAFRMSRRDGPSASDARSSDWYAEIKLSGFWETQEDFVDSLNTELIAAVSGWTWDSTTLFSAESLGSLGWRFVYRVGATNAYWLYIEGRAVGSYAFRPALSRVDNLARGTAAGGASWAEVGASADPVTTLVAGETYYADVNAFVPRGVLGVPTDPADGWWYTDDLRPGNSPHHLYLGGRTIPTTDHLISIDTGDGEASDEERQRLHRVTSINSGFRYVELPTAPLTILGPNTEITQYRAIYLGGQFSNFMTALTDDSPGLVNTGALPLITTDDVNSDYVEVRAAALGMSLAMRSWYVSGTVTLRDVIVHELRLRSCYMAVDETGKIKFKRLRPPLITDAATAAITADNTVGGFPSVSQSPYGHIGRIVIRQKWDVAEEEHKGPSINLRNVETSDASPTAGVLEIAPRSLPSNNNAPMEYTIEQAYLLASSRLGMFGGAYRTVTLEVNLTHFEIELGSVVSVSSSFLPNDDGSFGMANVPGLLIGFDWSPYQGTGQLTILLLSLDIGGYSPSLQIASATDTSAGAGTSWDLTATLSPHTAATIVSTWFAAGDEIRIIEHDSEAPDIFVGVIDSVTDPTTIAVTVTPSWGGVATSGDHFISYDTTPLVDEDAPTGRSWAQTDFASIAGADRRVAYASGDADAKEFSP